MPTPPHRALGRATETGAAFPTVPALHNMEGRFGFRFRRGQLIMVTGRPGAGKSNFVQWLVNQWPDTATLYCCYDMPAFTASVRQAAILTGDRVEDISAAVEADGPQSDYYFDALTRSRVEFCFDSSPALPDLQAELDAWVEKYDAYPDALVIDNLLNVEGAEEDHHQQKFILRELRSLVQRTGITVFVLHHATEGQKDTTRPPAMRETDGKVNQLPDVVLGVANDGGDTFQVAVLKQRLGRMDPGAEHPVTLFSDLSRVSFTAQRASYTGGGWYGGED